MRYSSFRFGFLSMAAACFLAFGGNAQAAPVDLLRQAYVSLGQADHDYKGHRRAAMKQVEAAARLLGANLAGEARNREPQGVSDDQLRAAEGLLEQAAPSLSGRPLKHVLAAERQINIALSIR